MKRSKAVQRLLDDKAVLEELQNWTVGNATLYEVVRALLTEQVDLEKENKVGGTTPFAVKVQTQHKRITGAHLAAVKDTLLVLLPLPKNYHCRVRVSGVLSNGVPYVTLCPIADEVIFDVNFPDLVGWKIFSASATDIGDIAITFCKV